MGPSSAGEAPSAGRRGGGTGGGRGGTLELQQRRRGARQGSSSGVCSAAALLLLVAVLLPRLPRPATAFQLLDLLGLSAHRSPQPLARGAFLVALAEGNAGRATAPVRARSGHAGNVQAAIDEFAVHL